MFTCPYSLASSSSLLLRCYIGISMYKDHLRHPALWTKQLLDSWPVSRQPLLLAGPQLINLIILINLLSIYIFIQSPLDNHNTQSLTETRDYKFGETWPASTMYLSISLSPQPRLQLHTHTPDFYMGARHPNIGPCACAASILSTEPFPWAFKCSHSYQLKESWESENLK